MSHTLNTVDQRSSDGLPNNSAPSELELVGPHTAAPEHRTAGPRTTTRTRRIIAASRHSGAQQGTAPHLDIGRQT